MDSLWSPGHPGKRLQRKLGRVCLGAMSLALSACAALPEPPPIAPSTASTAAPIVLETGSGALSARTTNAILKSIEKRSGTRDVLDKHLAFEEAVSRDSPLVVGNKLTLLMDGPNTYQAMFKAIAAARDHVHLETFIFEHGEVGQKFAELLLEKQAEGVQVNVIYDSVGSIDTPRSFFDRLENGGVRLVEFNPINPAYLKKPEWTLNNRDHRKLLIVDGQIAFLGGINISETYSSGSSLSESSKARRGSRGVGWRDTQLQIEGPVVAELQKLFLATWEKQRGAPLADRNYFPTLTRKGDGIVRVIGSTSDLPDNPIYLTLLSAIGHAEQAVHLTNAYFVPDPQLLKALTDAAGRGVEIKMVLPGKTDSWIVFHAGRSHYSALLDAGVQLYERQDTVLHAKTATIDGVWSTVGSSNLDWRSFLHNDELNAIVLGHDFARQMEVMFQNDVAASKRIQPEAWKRRSLFLRLQERLARLFEYWL